MIMDSDQNDIDLEGPLKRIAECLERGEQLTSKEKLRYGKDPRLLLTALGRWPDKSEQLVILFATPEGPSPLDVRRLLDWVAKGQIRGKYLCLAARSPLVQKVLYAKLSTTHPNWETLNFFKVLSPRQRTQIVHYGLIVYGPSAWQTDDIRALYDWGKQVGASIKRYTPGLHKAFLQFVLKETSAWGKRKF